MKKRVKTEAIFHELNLTTQLEPITLTNSIGFKTFNLFDGNYIIDSGTNLDVILTFQKNSVPTYR